jgi:hypothetical protein
MGIWHAAVYFKGAARHEDRVGAESALEWAEAQLRQLGCDASLEWRRTSDQWMAVARGDIVAVLSRREAANA